MIFALEDQRYALRLDTVEWVLRAVQITPLPKAPEVVLGVVDVRGTYLRRVRAATQRMGTLIDDMLALSRVARV